MTLSHESSASCTLLSMLCGPAMPAVMRRRSSGPPDATWPPPAAAPSFGRATRSGSDGSPQPRCSRMGHRAASPAASGGSTSSTDSTVLRSGTKPYCRSSCRLEWFRYACCSSSLGSIGRAATITMSSPRKTKRQGGVLGASGDSGPTQWFSRSSSGQSAGRPPRLKARDSTTARASPALAWLFMMDSSSSMAFSDCSSPGLTIAKLPTASRRPRVSASDSRTHSIGCSGGTAPAPRKGR
mmetsp:Transcript_63063/g.195246  ORF Transcript_63063/g.195246 Transcript_63063/m.195246 type:complete len:240 (-) Transcript_63063:52-771(-)